MSVETRLRHHLARRRNRGFTLIEIAVVMLIASLLLVGGLNVINATRTNLGLKETQTQIEALTESLQLFLLRNARLPCPADPALAQDDVDYATADVNDLGDIDAPCDPAREVGGDGATGLYWGTMPYRTLGLAPGAYSDGWDNQFFYFVNGGATVTNAVTASRWDYENTIELYDRATTPPARQLLVANGVVAILSAGPNGRGAYRLNGNRQDDPLATSLDERDNQDGDIELVAATYSDSATRPFDDVIQVYTEDQIFAPLAANGLVKTKRALTADRMETIVEAILGYAAADTADPDGVPRITTPPALPADHDNPCVFAPTVAPAATPGRFHYPCNAGLRRARRTIPLADNTGDGIGNTNAEAGVPYADLALIETDVVDAWGAPLRYDPNTLSSQSGGINVGIYSGNAEDPAFTVRSPGPDGTDGTADDITLRYSARELVGILARAGLVVD